MPSITVAVTVPSSQPRRDSRRRASSPARPPGALAHGWAVRVRADHALFVDAFRRAASLV
ncbi:hypothetical protein ACFPM0_18420 [Pseudonocardia sulfidoxydans]|uniref:hypothetical protein n=1 Tax=Pseudonocardia sulfidoxydans TaxID=54011 RepID=UPI00361FB754